MADDAAPPPEGTSRWQPDLSPEAQSHVEKMRKRIEPQIKMMQQIQASLGMSPGEFTQLLEMDEFDGLPLDMPHHSLTLSKLLDAVSARGGKLSLTIELNGTSVIIHD